MATNRPITAKWIWLFVPILLATACLKSKKPGLPPEVVHTIQSTGFNRVELVKAIAPYIESTDSLKLQAIYFLLTHMIDQYAVEYEISDSAGNIYNLKPLSFLSDSALFARWDSLSTAAPKFGYKAKKYISDRDTVTAALLINTINQAFEKQESDYLKYIPKEIFFQFVLPYRIGNETIEDWRRQLEPIAEHIIATSILQADSLAANVNRYVNSTIEFDKRFLKNAFEQQTDSLLIYKKGHDRDISWLKVKLLRTIGIPATVDYIPYLADSSHGLHFAVYYSPDGYFKPLLQDNEKAVFQKPERIPKVYRRIYHHIDSSLFALKDIGKTTPGYLGHYHYLDVTNQYVHTHSIRFAVDCPDTIVYLAVFNDTKWRAIDWTLCKDREAVFTQAGIYSNYQLGYVDQETEEFIRIPAVELLPD